MTATRASVGCQLYEVKIMLPGIDGTDKRVVTSWKVEDDGGPPSLVTAYLDI